MSGGWELIPQPSGTVLMKKIVMFHFEMSFPGAVYGVGVVLMFDSLKI